LLPGSINRDYCGPRGLLEGNGLMHMTGRLSRSPINTTFLVILALCLFFSFYSQLIVLFLVCFKGGRFLTNITTISCHGRFTIQQLVKLLQMCHAWVGGRQTMQYLQHMKHFIVWNFRQIQSVYVKQNHWCLYA